MSLKDTLVAKAAAIKTSVDATHGALEAGDLEAAKVEFGRLHAKLNGMARRAADHFGGDITTFSGGDGKGDD